MSEYYTICETNRLGMVMVLPPLLADKLDLEADRLAELKFGSLSVQTKVAVAQLPEANKTIGLSRQVLTSLMIPDALSFSIKPTGPSQFRVGPIIGILTFPHVIYLNQLRRYKNYAKTMNNSGLLYVFRPSDVRPETKTIVGFHYDEKLADWELREFPYPDVVIDRMYPNNFETHLKLEKIIGQNKIFNKKTLITKIEFNEVLSKDLFLQSVIPETKVFQSPQDLNYFLSKYGGVFLKPSDSMRGKGIIQITVDGTELIYSCMKGKEPAVTVMSWNECIYEVTEQINQSKRLYIIQAAVDRMEYMERPFCFRIMTTKDGSGKWTVPIVIAKAAPPGGFLTNVSSGADYIPLTILFEWLKEQLPNRETDYLNLLTDLSLKASIALDDEFGPLGKLGIDAVIDKSGKVWLIEANGNPGLIYRKGQSEFPAWRIQAYKHPLAYAFYLAGFAELPEHKNQP